jgi:hypothetical protein
MSYRAGDREAAGKAFLDRIGGLRRLFAGLTLAGPTSILVDA